MQKYLDGRTFPRITFDLHHGRLFVREGHLAFFVEAVLLEITDNPRHKTPVSKTDININTRGREGGLLLIINPRLQHDHLRPHIRQPTIMHQRTQPNRHPMRTPILLLPDEQMNPSIVVIQPAQQWSDAVLLRPVDLKVPERLAVPAAQHREAVARGEVVAQEFLLFGDGAAFAPCCVDARVVHPFVQEFEVCGAVLGLGLLHADGGGGGGAVGVVRGGFDG